MASHQTIKLKRSAVAGNVATAAKVDLGELAINTADGKIFFKRGDDSIQTVLTTNALVTGSLDLSGTLAISGSTSLGIDSADRHDITGSMYTAGSIYAQGSGRIYEAGTSVIDHATAMAIVFGG